MTNDISRTYLHHAVRGQVSSRLANLAEAISYGEDSERLLDIAETVMSVGHTSGMDTVTGLLVGLTAWENKPRFLYQFGFTFNSVFHTYSRRYRLSVYDFYKFRQKPMSLLNLGVIHGICLCYRSR